MWEAADHCMFDSEIFLHLADSGAEQQGTGSIQSSQLLSGHLSCFYLFIQTKP